MAVDLHVLKKFHDPNYPAIARIIWLLLIILCFSITLAQISNRILHYMSQPVTISIQIRRNETMEFPLITVCNKFRFQKSSLHKLYREFRQRHPQTPNNISINNLIDEFGVIPTLLNASYNIPDMLHEVWITVLYYSLMLSIIEIGEM